MIRSRHIPELDGLRGIAILTVLSHHQLIPLSLSGGFLGVDLFFVLSGFLITGLLLTEFRKTGSISLRNFYARRVLRLGPALLLYLVACIVVTYYTQLLGVIRELKLIGLALIYSTNWRMAFNWDDSLDPTAIIWSLSIEEQFYLVWPVVFVACLSRRLRQRSIVVGLLVVVVSVAVHRYSLFSQGVHLTRLYYGTDTRADALLLGCLAALLPVSRLSVKSIRLIGIAGCLAAASLTYFLYTSNFTDQFLYRGGFSLVAVLTGILLIAAANSPPRILSLVLRFPVLRWFGKISYGLYLWHWIVIRTTTFYYLGYWEPWAKLALAVAISAASFYLVELRFNRMKSRFSLGSMPASDPSPHITVSPERTALSLPSAS